MFGWLEGAGTRVALCACLAGPALADEAAPGYAGVDIFDLPALHASETLILDRAAQGDLDAAAAEIDALIDRYPKAARLQVVRAALALVRGDKDTADAAAERAKALGADGTRPERADSATPGTGSHPGRIGDQTPSEPAPIEAALVEQGEARVGPANTGWDPALGRLVAQFQFPPILQTHAFLEDPSPGTPLVELQQLVARGRAAGNVGDLYDNRDRGHSVLKPGNRTQLSHVVYGAEAKAAGIDYGLNTQILFDAPTFGNSSTAMLGPLWRSQPRLALTTPGGAFRLWQNYANNHLYVFPEHRDHDPQAEGGQGDLIPANTPYVLVSQGSSGSDQPFLEAVQAILAAFRPEVKAKLVEERLIAPTIQQIFRRSLVSLDEGDYLGPRAHPSVFLAEDIDLAAMITAAQALGADEIPPMVTLRMVDETPAHPSIFADGLNERLFDTPSAIARVWRGAQHERQYEIVAEAEDPNGRPLTYHWRVLRGDKDRVRIAPQDDSGARVRIALPWHEPMPVAGRPGIASPRVDIAVFADNGAQLSAPAFFSILYPAHQEREYAADGRPLRIEHSHHGVYADPLLWPGQDWTDVFDYDDQGRLLGWTRTTPDREIRFTSQGLEVLEVDTRGRASLAGKVEYPLVRGADGLLVVDPAATGQRFRFEYAGEADRIGRPVPVATGD